MRALSASLLLSTSLVLLAQGCADGEDPKSFQPEVDGASEAEASTPDGSAGSAGKDASPDGPGPDAQESGGQPADGALEAAAESGVDAEADGAVEASEDAPGDVTTEPAVEAGPDAPPEAGADAPSEVSVEAGALPLIYITEIYVDVALQGDDDEWVAIAAAPGTPIGELKLRHFKWAGSSKPLVQKFDLQVAPAGTLMPSSGYWLVGGYSGPTDQGYGIASWGLDSSSGSVQLYRASTLELLDAVGYGDAEPAEAPSEPLVTMQGSAAGMPAPGTTEYSIARKPGGTLFDNSLDFCVQLATPKADNPGVCQ